MNSPQEPCHPLTLRIPPLALLAIIGTATWLGARAVAPLNFEYGARRWLTACLVALGFISSLWGVASFRRARTTVDPMHPHAATALVVSGIYGFTRNPMYLGFLFFLLGEIAWLANPVALIGAPVFVLYLNRFQIAPEESALTQRFGAEFTHYASRVPRWL
ncbi:MAG TPA: isoprenylcysteine carboxylmethyltransferase family protein [Lacunisphaera sp.]